MCHSTSTCKCESALLLLQQSLFGKRINDLENWTCLEVYAAELQDMHFSVATLRKRRKKRSWHKTIFSNFNGRNLKKKFTYFNCCSFFNSSGLRAKKSGGNATVLLTWLGSKTLGLRSSSARIGSAPTKASLN